MKQALKTGWTAGYTQTLTAMKWILLEITTAATLMAILAKMNFGTTATGTKIVTTEQRQTSTPKTSKNTLSAIL